MATSVFVLQHVTTGPEGEQETRLLGVYSSQVEAESASDRAVKVAEFSAFPDGFEISPFVLDRDAW